MADGNRPLSPVEQPGTQTAPPSRLGLFFPSKQGADHLALREPRKARQVAKEVWSPPIKQVLQQRIDFMRLGGADASTKSGTSSICRNLHAGRCTRRTTVLSL